MTSVKQKSAAPNTNTNGMISVKGGVEADLARTLSVAQIRQRHQQIGALSANNDYHWWRVGEALLAHKAKAGHGNWEDWVRDNMNFGPRMAAKYTSHAKRFRGRLVTVLGTKKWEEAEPLITVAAVEKALVNVAEVKVAKKTSTKATAPITEPVWRRRVTELIALMADHRLDVELLGHLQSEVNDALDRAVARRDAKEGVVDAEVVSVADPKQLSVEKEAE